jgi:hypothetical protein
MLVRGHRSRSSEQFPGKLLWLAGDVQTKKSNPSSVQLDPLQAFYDTANVSGDGGNHGEFWNTSAYLAITIVIGYAAT